MGRGEMGRGRNGKVRNWKGEMGMEIWEWEKCDGEKIRKK